MTDTITLSAEFFLALISLKFIAGAVGNRLGRNTDVTADAELLVVILWAIGAYWFFGWAASAAIPAAAVAYFASTLWSLMSLNRTKALLQITRGGR